jgi:predicted RNase H-like HicB family nuclease
VPIHEHGAPVSETARVTPDTSNRDGKEGETMGKVITVTLQVEREDDQYVSLCPELDIASYGDTVEEALAHLDNAVSIYLDTIEEDGERERIFRERGIKIEERQATDYKVSVHPGVMATVGRFPVGTA